MIIFNILREQERNLINNLIKILNVLRFKAMTLKTKIFSTLNNLPRINFKKIYMKHQKT